jgi:hypothetical protein
MLLYEQHKVIAKSEEIMCNICNDKQLNRIKQPGLGSHGKQHLLFLLVHLILCYKVESQTTKYKS